MSQWVLGMLPTKEVDLETPRVLKQLNEASRALAELKGAAYLIPNQEILITTLTLQEANESSAIESIITTQDDLYKSELEDFSTYNPETKEVKRYASALREAYIEVKKKGIITLGMVNSIQAKLIGTDTGLRKIPGTTLKNARTGEIIYQPPQRMDEIESLMDNLIKFINDDELSGLDPLIKMAIIHHQFESIHPYYDGNGRTGRILNILYIVGKELLDLPILYLSRYIVKSKNRYYEVLQRVRSHNEWEEFVLYMLEGIEKTSKETISTIKRIAGLMQEVKNKMRNSPKKIYSQELLNIIFKYPYTKIEFLTLHLDINRVTASKYLSILVELGILKIHKVGRQKYFVNTALVRILASD